MTDTLKELSDQRRAEAYEREKRFSYRDILRSLNDMPPAMDFASAFKGAAIHVIAELAKTKGDSHVSELAEELADAGAAALAVPNEEYLRKARRCTDIPILFKDFITTRYQVAEARMAGADAILLIASVLSDADLVALKAHAHELGMKCLCETHSAHEIERAVNLDFGIIGVDRPGGLLDTLPRRVIRVAQWELAAHEDILAAQAAGANGYLVGTPLMQAERPGLKLRELIG